jgi:hypothetical protein
MAITLRLEVEEINTLYKELLANDDFELAEKIKQQADAIVETWDGHVRSEVNALLDLYLPESASGNVGIKYRNPPSFMAEGGESTAPDTTKISGVEINLVFDFDKVLTKV